MVGAVVPYLVKRPALITDASRQDFLDRFDATVGPLTTKNIAGYPSFDARRLNDDDACEKFRALAREFVDAALAVTPEPAHQDGNAT